jgi:aminopeptidase N
MIRKHNKWRNIFAAGVFLALTLYGQVTIPEKQDRNRTNSQATLSKILFDSTSSFDVMHYRFDLFFPYQSSAFRGSVTLFIRAMQELTGIDLQMGDLTIDHILLRGSEVSYVHEDETLALDFSEFIVSGDTFSLMIQYHGAPDERGFYFKDRCAYTMAEPEKARYWFPGHDVPWDKATAELFVTVPVGVKVASVGLLKSRTLSMDRLSETFYWSTDFPVATYLICITMSDEYSVWSDWYVKADGDSVEMPYYVFTGDSAKSRIDVQNMGHAMKFYTDAFGEYPFEKYGTAEVTEGWFDGMEHQTMTTIVQRWFQGSEDDDGVFVHELAHSWWGNAVTLSDWKSIWLNEGFATYSELLYREHAYGNSYFRSALDYLKNAYFRQAETIDWPIYDPPDLFNWQVTYIKGAWVLHMLRRVVGEEVFWRILPLYFRTYQYRNASIPEFQAVCESISGMDLDWFFQQWIYQDGYMRILYNWESVPNSETGFEIGLYLEQDSPLFVMPLDIRIESTSVTLDTTILFSENTWEGHFNLPDPAADVKLDPQRWVLLSDSLVEMPPSIVQTPRLYPSGPNPFSQTTMLSYMLPLTRPVWTVTLSVYNLSGQKVRVIFQDQQNAGIHSVLWDGCGSSGLRVPSGIYIIRLDASGSQMQRKAILIQ